MKTNHKSVRIDADTSEWGRVVDTGYIISQSKTYALVHADKLRADIRVRCNEIHEELEGFNATDKPAAHTLTPWIVDDNPRNVGIRNEEHGRIASLAETTFGQDLANAAFIVRAVNAHESLVNCLKNMTDHLNYLEEREGWAENIVSLQAKIIIAKAEGK